MNKKDIKTKKVTVSLAEQNNTYLSNTKNEI